VVNNTVNNTVVNNTVNNTTDKTDAGTTTDTTPAESKSKASVISTADLISTITNNIVDLAILEKLIGGKLETLTREQLEKVYSNIDDFNKIASNPPVVPQIDLNETVYSLEDSKDLQSLISSSKLDANSIMAKGGLTPKGTVNIDFTAPDGKTIYKAISNGLSQDNLVSSSEQASLLTWFDSNGDRKVTNEEIVNGYKDILKNTTTPDGLAKFQEALSTISKKSGFDKLDTATTDATKVVDTTPAVVTPTVEEPPAKVVDTTPVVTTVVETTTPVKPTLDTVNAALDVLGLDPVN
jgi:hypothetical protein